MIKNFKLINSCLEEDIINEDTDPKTELASINWDSVAIASLISNFGNFNIDIEKLTSCKNIQNLDNFINELVD